MSTIFPTKRKRLLTYLLLALFTGVGCYITFLLKSDARFIQQLTLGFGYISLILIVVTLLIGPCRIIGRRHSSANIYLRRDIGIWAGISGILHILFGFQVHLKGQILLYFFKPEGVGYMPLLTMFGVSNYIGAIAAVVLALLLTLSNNISLRWLKGRRWKLLQRFNYPLFVLVVAHTLGYQIVVKRERAMMVIAVGLTILVLAMQSLGFFLYGRPGSNIK